MFNNTTRNQHYISQVEQKLNSINYVSDRKKRRIYQFEVLNREFYEYKITNEDGVKIERNLSFDDLYSIEIFDNATRDNFEQYFKKLEDEIEKLTVQILDSKQIGKGVLLTLFNAKFMNVIRNPYCILSTLNTFNDICKYVPTDSKLVEYYLKIESVKTDQLILSEFEVNQEQFRQWLKIIFYLVIPISCPNGEYLNFMPDIIKKLFDIRNKRIFIALVTHENQICLLSDRAHVDISEALPGDSIGYEFNLTKNAFIHITFADNSLEKIQNIPDYMMKKFREQGINKIVQPSLKIQKICNDDESFRAYNARVIYYSHKYFYSADTLFLK